MVKNPDGSNPLVPNDNPEAEDHGMFHDEAPESEVPQALLGLTVSGESEKGLASGFEETCIESCGLRIMMALRRIMHHVDMYSRKLAGMHNITGPQLICLYAIVREGPLTLSDLGKRVSLSTSTVNGIVDRLEYKSFVLRERKDKDRRKVLISATPAGLEVTTGAPLPLQDRLASAIGELPELEQISIALSLERMQEK